MSKNPELVIPEKLKPKHLSENYKSTKVLRRLRGRKNIIELEIIEIKNKREKGQISMQDCIDQIKNLDDELIILDERIDNLSKVR